MRTGLPSLSTALAVVLSGCGQSPSAGGRAVGIVDAAAPGDATVGDPASRDSYTEDA